MIKLLFICHGNICRSSASEYIMRDLVKKENLSDEIYIESKGTSSEELGNPMYPPMRELLKRNGIDSSFHRARQVEASDYQKFDLFLAMDQYNIRNLNRVFNDTEHKIKLLPSFGGLSEIDDPWYTREFKRAYDEILVSCQGLLKYLKGELENER